MLKVSNNIIAFVLFLIMALAVPFIPSDYLFDAILTPFLAVSLAALGLNLLAGYTGQVSLGSAAYMAIGAFATYDLLFYVPGLPLLAAIFMAGLITAAISILFGLPGLRLRGFYLAISTLAAQFFVQWVFTNFPWFSGGDSSGVVTAPPVGIGGLAIDSPARRYLLALVITALLTGFAIALTRSRVGQNFIAIRDNELAARVLGINILKTKLIACAASGFYIGIAGALWAFLYVRLIEPAGYDLNHSFEILFAIIIGGLASVRGAFLGSFFMVVLPLLLSRAGATLFGATFDSGLVDISEQIILGLLIILFLRLEPQGLAALLTRISPQTAQPYPLSPGVTHDIH
jgi:branched-chain amino acid transport system permease protein